MRLWGPFELWVREMWAWGEERERGWGKGGVRDLPEEVCDLEGWLTLDRPRGEERPSQALMRRWEDDN